MPDMTNAEAAARLQLYLDGKDNEPGKIAILAPGFTKKDALRSAMLNRKMLETALAALAPKVDENGHALCGCGEKVDALDGAEYGKFIFCHNCSFEGAIYLEEEDAWIKWNRMRGLRRDA